MQLDMLKLNYKTSDVITFLYAIQDDLLVIVTSGKLVKPSLLNTVLETYKTEVTNVYGTCQMQV